jgi:RNA polymerase sigma factor (sigma-70 family)
VEAASIGHAREGARRVEAMVARHGSALLRVANQFSLCHDDALDAYQRGLEIYLRHLDRVDPATEGAWLRVVVKHEAMAIRRARQESVAHEDVDLDATVSALREVDEAVAGGERVERSVEALRALKPDEAKALMLKAQGLSYQEIGRRFGWTYTKVNRSITEGRKRFMETFRGIEDGEACAGHAEALAALADGTATSAQIVALRPHLRHCAACRATVREMRFSRTRRIALLIPGLPWLARVFTRAAGSDVSTGAQYAAATGGGRLGPAAALLGICLGGAGAAVCATTGALPAAPPLISHVVSHPHRNAAAPPRHHRAALRRAAAPAAAPTAAAPPATAVAPATATPSSPHRAVVAPPRRRRTTTAHRRATAAKTRPKEFGFEGSAAGTPAPTAAPASVHLASAGTTTASPPAPARHPAAATAPSGEFGFEGGG